MIAANKDLVVFDICDSTIDRLCKLLLDEEGSQMRKLPCACDTKYSELKKRPAHNSRISSFALVSEFRLSFLLLVRKCPA